MTVTTKEVKEKLSSYLAGQLAGLEFEEWFALALRDGHKSGDPGTEELIQSIEWAFCDLERGLATKAQLQNNLWSLVSTESAGSPTQQGDVHVAVLDTTAVAQALAQRTSGNGNMFASTGFPVSASGTMGPCVETEYTEASA